MSLYGHYLLVIVVWSTTPMAIKLSSESLSSEAAILFRIALALVVILPLGLFFKHCRLHTKHYLFYMVGGLSIFPNMSLVYLSSNYISSGLISVLFALVPLFTFMLNPLFGAQLNVAFRHVLAFVIALLGLLLIFVDQLHLGSEAIIGILLMLSSNIIFTLSQLGIRKLHELAEVKKTSKPAAIEQSIGSMLFSLPGLAFSWYCADGTIPETMSSKGLYAVIYLALVGSLLGFIAYYSVLQYLPMLWVTMIPMITPMLALWMGALFLSEQVTVNMLLGSVLILLALAIYENIWRLVLRLRPKANA